MRLVRRFTHAETSPFDQFDYTKRSSILRNTDGSVVFQMDNIEVPSQWSQVATDILAQKYFRKAGVPQVQNDGSSVLDEQGKQVETVRDSPFNIYGRTGQYKKYVQ